MGVEREIEREDDGGGVGEEMEEAFAAAAGAVMMDYVKFEGSRVGLMQECWNWADAREREWELKDVS